MLSSRVFAISSLLALVAGCSDSTSPAAKVTGSFSFTYSGTAATGSFSASGSAPTGGTLGATAFAHGYRVATESHFGVVGVVPRSGQTHDFTVLFAPNTGPGTTTIAECQTESTCSGLLIVFGSSNSGDTFTLLCGLDAGSITVTELSNTRAKGTFSGSGECFGPSGTVQSFTVTGGTFDVPVSTDTPVPM
jgi:hypothetical protein